MNKRRKPSFKNLPKIQAKRDTSLRLEKERKRAGRVRARQAAKRSPRESR